MSDHELRPDILDAGHRKATKKPAKVDGTVGKPEKLATKTGAKDTKAKRKGLSLGSGMRTVGVAVARPFGFLKTVSNRFWRVWDRAYDNAMARPVHAVKVFAIVVAAVAVLGGLCWLGGDHYASLNATRGEAAQEGQAAVAQLMSYNWHSIDRQVEKTQDLLTGKFKDDYAKFVNSSIAPSAMNKQVSVQTSVDRSAIISSSTSEVVMLMFLDQQSEAQLNSDGDTSISSVRVTLEKEDGKWKVSELTPV